MSFGVEWNTTYGFADLSPNVCADWGIYGLRFDRYWPEKSVHKAQRLDFMLTAGGVGVLGYVTFFEGKPFVYSGSDNTQLADGLQAKIADEAKKLLAQLPKERTD
jgi:hypothetical protein